MEERTYLGDSVYAQIEHSGIVILTTNSHVRAHADNVIILEPEVLDRLTRWLAQRETLAPQGSTR